MVRTRTRRQMPAKKLSARWHPDERRWLDDFLSGVRTQFADAVRDVVIYGSKARGDWHEASDIDVLIILADEREGEDSLANNLREASAERDVADYEASKRATPEKAAKSCRDARAFMNKVHERLVARGIGRTELARMPGEGTLHAQSRSGHADRASIEPARTPERANRHEGTSGRTPSKMPTR